MVYGRICTDCIELYGVCTPSVVHDGLQHVVIPLSVPAPVCSGLSVLVGLAAVGRCLWSV